MFFALASACTSLMGSTWSTPDYTPLDDLTAKFEGDAVSGQFLLWRQYDGDWGAHGEPKFYVSNAQNFDLSNTWHGPYTGVAAPTSGSKVVTYSLPSTIRNGWLLVMIGGHRAGTTNRHQQHFAAVSFPQATANKFANAAALSRRTASARGARKVRVNAILPITLHRPIGTPWQIDRMTYVKNWGRGLSSETDFSFVWNTVGTLGSKWDPFTPNEVKGESDGQFSFRHRLKSTAFYSVYAVHGYDYSGGPWLVASGVIRHVKTADGS